MARRRKRRPNRGSFKRGPDSRRHVFTQEERRRGGLSCAAKFTCHGRWWPDWWDRCARKIKTPGGYVDAQEEEGDDRDHGPAGGTPAGNDDPPW